MTHGAYLHVVRLKMDEIGILPDADELDLEDAKELVTILPTMALEHVVNSPDGIQQFHSWGDDWLKLCQEEYMQRCLLL